MKSGWSNLAAFFFAVLQVKQTLGIGIAHA